MDMELEATCQTLKKALKGNKDTLIHLVIGKNQRDRLSIRDTYKEIFGKELIEDVNKELSGNFRRVIVDLFRSPEERDAYYLYKSMKRMGTNDETLIEILCSRSNHDVFKINEKFKSIYNTELEKMVYSETSGDIQKLLISIVQCKRSENANPNDEECKKLAKELYNGGVGKISADSETFYKVFALSSPPELLSINSFYQELASKSLKSAVEKDFSGNMKTALITILESTISPSDYYASRIYKAVKGLGTNDKMLIRNIVLNEGSNMKEIRESYKNLYSKDMLDDIKGDTSGDYQKILLLIAGGN